MPPFTVLSCDNLLGNGDTLRASVVSFANQSDPDLGAWIAHEVCFPNTMVDRIVPAVTPEKRNEAADVLSCLDEAPVFTEPFSQWVIEDRFTSGRPCWDRVGVIFTEDVTHFENMKLRLLNGSHSTMAYLGLLMGLDTVDACIQDPTLGPFVETMMRSELMPTVVSPAGYNVEDYIRELLSRFANPALKHNCAQIAMDGSKKLPARLFCAAVRTLGAERKRRLHPESHIGMVVFCVSERRPIER